MAAVVQPPDRSCRHAHRRDGCNYRWNPVPQWYAAAVRILRRITGAGCMLTSLTGVYCGANPDILLEAAVTASEVMKHCGETAEARVRKEMEGTASFRTRLIDAVSLLNADELTTNLCLQIL